MKKIIVTILLFELTISGCSQQENLGPGYGFSLFKNTASASLALAVEKEDTIAIGSIIGRGGVNIDYQEPQYGNTLLSLAVCNGKLSSVSTLLKAGADFNVLDSNHFAAIHEATDFIDLRKNVPQILSLLLQYGADPNMAVESTMTDYITFSRLYTPLMGGIQDLECTKLLLSHGADLYIHINGAFPIWYNLFMLDIPSSNNIFVAKYLIVDKKYKVPEILFYRADDRKAVSTLSFIEKIKVNDDLKKESAKKEILAYLYKIGFPEKGAYKDK